jgi:hypothetical protein
VISRPIENRITADCGVSAQRGRAREQVFARLLPFLQQKCEEVGDLPRDDDTRIERWQQRLDRTRTLAR